MAVVSPNGIRAPGARLALIERDEPLAALARHLTEAAAGSGRFVVLRGEAGIGKTALLREFLRTSPPGVTIRQRRTSSRSSSSLTYSPAMIVLPAPGSSASKKRSGERGSISP